MSKRYKVLVTTALGALALVTPAITTVAPATAGVTGTDSVARTLDDNPGGFARFYADDEILEVCDLQADGLRAYGSVVYSDSTGSYFIRIEDANGSHPIGDCARKDLNIDEGVKITLSVCLKDGANGTLRYCYSTTNGRS